MSADERDPVTPEQREKVNAVLAAMLAAGDIEEVIDDDGVTFRLTEQGWFKSRMARRSARN